MGKLTWLELKAQFRSPLLLAVALAAALIYAVPEALDPGLGWAQFGVQVAAWSSILLSLAYFYALVRALGKDTGGTREMVWARPVASSPYVLSKLAASAGVLILLWLLTGLAAGAVRVAVMGVPTASEAVRYLLFGATLALPNLLFMAAALLFLTALTGRLPVVYGAGLLLWLVAALLPRDSALGALYPFSVPPSTFSEAAGFGGFWRVLLQNRLYSLLAAALLVLAAGYALSRRRRAPERHALYLVLGGLPLLALLLALLAAAPSPAEWLERSRATWQARALATARGDAAEPWQAQKWNGVEGFILPGGEALRAASTVRTQADPKLAPPRVITIVQVPFLQTPKLEGGTLLLPESYAALSPEAITRRVIGTLAEAKLHVDKADGTNPARAARVYLYEWYLLEAARGQEALEDELALWRTVAAPVEREDIEAMRARTEALNALQRLGAFGEGFSANVVSRALELWDGRVRREEVATVLREGR